MVENSDDAIRTLYVFLHDKIAGKLNYNGSIYQYEYDDEYLKRTDALPVSFSLPLRAGLHTGAFSGKELPHYFYHLLPEGWLLNLAKTLKMPTGSPMDLLSLLVMETIGAIRISKDKAQLPPDRNTSLVDDPLILDPNPVGPAPFVKKHKFCLYCGSILVSPGINDNYHPACSLELFGSQKPPRFTIDRDKIKEVALRQLQKGESLTGVQEKFSLRHRKDRTTIAAPLSCFVAKPQPWTPDLAELASIEGAYMLFARRLDLPVAKTGVIYLADGTPCFISKRFDISSEGRIHQEDLAAPLSKYEKYESSHEGIANLLVENKSVTDAENHADRMSFLKVTLFNFLLGNTDAHLKNFALFQALRGSKHFYKLTPYYDIFPSLLYAPRDTDELGLNLGSRKNKLDKSSFESLARRLQLGPRTVSAFIDNFRSLRNTLIQSLDTYEITQPLQYRVLELAKRRLAQLDS